MSVHNFRQGMIIMLVCMFLAVVIGFAGGFILDSVFNGLVRAGAYDDLPDDWNDASLINSSVNLFHLSAIAIAIAGVLAFVMTILREESVDEQYSYRY